MRLRQVALVARDLEPVERAIVDQLQLELCYRDPAVATFGLKNALFPVGDKLLEVVSPLEEGTTAGRLLDKRGGDGGYMVIVQVEDLDAMRARCADSGVRIVFEAVVPGITGLHLHPRDVGGAILSVDRSATWEDWPWAGPSWREHRSTSVVDDLVAVEIQAAQPAAMAERWAQVLGRPAANGEIALDEGRIRFVPISDDRGEGLSAVEFSGRRAVNRDLDICGCRITIKAG